MKIPVQRHDQSQPPRVAPKSPRPAQSPAAPSATSRPTSSSAPAAPSRPARPAAAPSPRPAPEAPEPSSPRPARRALPIVLTIIGVVLVALAVFLVLFWRARHADPADDAASVPTTPEVVTTVDLDQRVTDAAGHAFSATYALDSGDDLTVRFADQTCTAHCSNLRNLKLGDQNLTKDKDYVVVPSSDSPADSADPDPDPDAAASVDNATSDTPNPDSADPDLSTGVTFTIFASALANLTAGDYNLTFKVVQDDKILTVGTRLTLTGEALTCADGQVLRAGQCVDAPPDAADDASDQEQDPEQDQSPDSEPDPADGSEDGSADDPSADSATTPDAADQSDQSAQSPDPASPSNPDPTPGSVAAGTLSRADYTATGGWESQILRNYADHLRRVKLSGENYTGHRNYLSSVPCYGSYQINIDALTISNPQWDTETSTCGNVDSELPPVPSADDLTRFLRQVAASDCVINDADQLQCRNQQW